MTAHFNWLDPLIFDLGSRLVFLPVGGIDAVREQTLTALDIRPGSKVLELGCGTGALTTKLVRRGASVTAVDLSKSMLGRARQRAPSAAFLQSDILDYKSEQKFDRVLLAFVLHHLEATARVASLRLASGNLAEGGLIGILDWSEPSHPSLRWALRTLIATVEPSSATDWIEQGFGIHLEKAGLSTLRSRDLAAGSARVVIAAPVKPSALSEDFVAAS